MSITAIAWAFKVEAPSSPAKFVLVKLADNANDAGLCWPSIDHLARHTQLSSRAVREQIRKLEESGLLETEHRKTEGVNLPNMYRLRIEQYSAVLNKVQEGTASSSGGVRNHIQEGTEPGSAKPSIEPSKRTVIEPSTSPEPLSRSALVLLPTINGNDFPVTEEIVSEYQTSYPAVDVLQQVHEMRGWCLSNPTKRKTGRGMMRFMNTWLSQAQNRSGLNGRRRPTAHDNFIAGAYLAASEYGRARKTD